MTTKLLEWPDSMVRGDVAQWKKEIAAARAVLAPYETGAKIAKPRGGMTCPAWAAKYTISVREKRLNYIQQNHPEQWARLFK